MIRDDILVNNPLLVVDIGASGGIDNRWEKFTSYFIAILFEPCPREFQLLKSKSKDNCIILNSVLSDSVKEIDFHLCKKQQLSSVYLPNFTFLNNFPDAERFDVQEKIKLTTDTLDNQLKQNNISEIDFIKIDTQGYELPILQGSSDILEKVIGLELEVEFANMYKDQPLFGEVNEFIRKNNFELYDLKRYYWKRKNFQGYSHRKGQLVFGDALYFKSPENILSIAGVTEEKIIRSFCVYLIYGYSDLAQTLLSLSYDKRILSKAKYNSALLLLSKFKDRNPIPDFRGKGRIYDFLVKIANIFSNKGSYSGTDRVIGNS